MYILDTHTLLWLFDEDENLSSSAKNIILTEDTLYWRYDDYYKGFYYSKIQSKNLMVIVGKNYGFKF